MKNKFLITILCLSVALSSCKKFLEEQSQDEIRPSTTIDLSSLLSAEGYPYKVNLSPILEILSDNVQCYGGQGQTSYVSIVRKGRSPYTWSKEMFQELLLPDGLANTTFVNSWQILYSRIAGCNTVIAYTDKVNGTVADKNSLRGQALALRGYYYFHLVNLFAQPYNAPGKNPETEPGVPLKLRMEVSDSLYPRNTVAEVYRQIESDLKEAATLLGNAPPATSVYKMSDLAVNTLLSRVYLYQGKWDEAILYADKVIAKRPALTLLSSYKASPPGGYNTYNNGTAFVYSNRIYDPILSKEILWAYLPEGNVGIGGSTDEIFKSSMAPGYSNTMNPPYATSSQLMSLYDSRPVSDTGIYLADLRSRTYFVSSAYLVSFFPVFTFGYKFYGGSLGTGGSGIRTAEAYLNRAEAKIQKFIKAGDGAARTAALSDINTLRISRYDPRQPYVQINITDGQQLLTFCRDERRREFPFEGHRWFDLRRYGMPSISHFYEEAAGTGQTFTLSQGDSRYTLQIPRAALERNAQLIQNP